MGFGCRLQAQTPAKSAPAWVTHKDTTGFEVQLPRGWGAEGAQDGHVLIHSADKSVFAVLQPFTLQNGGSATDWIAPLVKHMNTLFPKPNIMQNQQVSTQPDEAVAKIAYTANGKAGQANILCYINNGAGMFFAIGAPSDLFAAKKPTLLKILSSFHYGPPAERGNTTQTASMNGPLTYKTWKDPQEGAFSVEVPSGWHVIGGLFRFAPIDARRQIDVVSPDKQIHIQSGEARLSTFAPPGPSSQVRGLREGQSYDVNGVRYTVMHYMDGSEFSKEYAGIKFKKEHPDLKIAETKDRPDVEEMINSRIAKQGLSQFHSTVGETDFTYSENGKTVNGACIVATIRIGQGVGEIWLALPSTITAPADKMAMARDILTHIVLHTTDDPEWTAKQQQVTQEFTQMVMRNHEIAMQQIRAQYEKFTHQMEENQRQFSNVINNEVDVKNSFGDTFKAVGGHNYYWQQGSTIVGTDTYRAPDINFTPLEKF
jgi:hypothetical protein